MFKVLAIGYSPFICASRPPLTLDAILENVNRIYDMSHQIAIASEEQSVVSEDVNRNVQSINTIAAEAATGSSQIASESRHLSQLAERLQTMISAFKI